MGFPVDMTCTGPYLAVHETTKGTYFGWCKWSCHYLWDGHCCDEHSIGRATGVFDSIAEAWDAVRELGKERPEFGITDVRVLEMEPR